MDKIAVVFPGVGYNKDRPLLYYAGKLAAGYGYRLVHVDFTGLDWSKDKLKDQEFLKQTMARCMTMTDTALEDLGDLSGDEVVFISKSIGTVVATAYAAQKGINARHVCFSPLEMIGDHIPEGGGILFYGDADPYADYRSIERVAADKKLEIRRIIGGNHSLETGNVFADMENLKIMMQLTAGYIGV